MSAATSMDWRRHDGRLWAFALALSLVVNALLALMAGLALQDFHRDRPKPLAAKQPPEETITIIAPEESAVPDLTPAPPPPADDRKPFTRTSDDQLADRPEIPTRIGERDTRATSDAPPDPTAPNRPSQAGVEPLYEGHVETTESRYQDGELADSKPAGPEQPAPPTPPQPLPADVAAAATTPGSVGARADAPGTANEARTPPPEETLATSSLPVDVPVPMPEPEAPPEPEPSVKELPKPGNPELTEESPDDGPDPNLVKEAQPKPATTPQKPTFRGNQQRTVLRGSLSRTGRSALDVENTPLGRYQAQISRAVELEWQRNCVRYRDFITPGFLTIQFSVNSRGKVVRRDFVGSMQAGEHQKGFTLDSIRDARIPPMPPELGKEFKDDPLELIFNFYF